jgi:hypothetical protein
MQLNKARACKKHCSNIAPSAAKKASFLNKQLFFRVYQVIICQEKE